MTDSATPFDIVPSRLLLRRRAERLAAAFGLIAGVWVGGRMLHQDLLAGLLVIAAIGVGGFLLTTVTQLQIGRVRGC